MLSYSIGKDSITLFIDGELANVDSSHKNYPKLREELLKPDGEQDLAKIKSWSSIEQIMRQFKAGAVTVTESEILFEGKPVSGYIVDRILETILEDGNVDAYVNFFLNLQNNPNKDVAGDLFKWCETGKMPITPDGCIIGFKKVNSDYTDCHTGKFSNKPGSILAMPRDVCDPSRSNTCSTGFHFCSASYLGSFRGERVMAVKVNPADVTAIPKDYNNAKGRCCRYEVTNELSDASAAKHDVWSKAVANPEDPREFPDEFFTEKKTPRKKTVTTKKGEPKVEKPVAEKKPRISIGSQKAADAAMAKATPKFKPKNPPKPKAADHPETVKDIVKKAAAKAKEPKIKVAKVTPTSPEAKSIVKQVKAAVKKVIAPTPVAVTPFKNQVGGHWTEQDIARAKAEVMSKKLTVKAAADQLLTSPSTLHGWFKKV